MLLLRMFLLVMLIGESKSGDPQTEEIPNCDKMQCFIYPTCLNSDSLSTDFIHYTADYKVVKNCEAILKIRPFSLKHYFIIMESYSRQIFSIKIEQGPTFFECKRDENDRNIVLMESSEPKNMLTVKEKKSLPLRCEFFVRSENDVVFKSTGDVVKFKSSNTNKMPGAIFHSYCAATCDPDSVKPSQTGPVVDKTVISTNADLDVLTCPAGYQLSSRNDATSDFKPTGKIECKKSGDDYKFEPALKEARCEVDTCTQCPDALDGFETFNEGICTKLRCKNEFRIKVDGAEPEMGSAECKYVDNKEHVWQFKGKTLTSSTASCVEKMKCFKDDAAVKAFCKNCILNPADNMPRCPSDTDKIMYETQEMILTCDDATGKVKYYAVEMNMSLDDLPPGKITCVTKAAGGAAEGAAKAGSGDSTPYIVLGAVLGLGLLAGVGVGLFFFMKRRKQGKTPPATGAKVGEKKEANPKSANSQQSTGTPRPEQGSGGGGAKAPPPAAPTKVETDYGRAKRLADEQQANQPRSAPEPEGGDETVCGMLDTAGNEYYANMNGRVPG